MSEKNLWLQADVVLNIKKLYYRQILDNGLDSYMVSNVIIIS